MKKVLYLLIIFFALILIFVLFYLQKTKNNEPLGGDRDSHGCIGSAGYSWCEQKNECLRIWEEKCE